VLPKIEVSTELRALATRSIDHAEQAFDLFFAAAAHSPKASQQQSILSLSRDNMRATLDYARGMVQITEPQEIVRAHAAFIKRLLASAQRQMLQMSDESQGRKNSV
jgi:hypothetical protein